MQVLPQIPSASEVREELDSILRSTVFRGSKRCQDFLRFVSTKSLEGAAETLKERTLATEVFGRQSTVDLGEDSIVRVGAREVRKRLAQYYVTDGANDAVRIELPAGSYVPTFHFHGTRTEAPATEPVFRVAESELPAAPAIGREPERNRRWWQVAAAFSLLGLLAASVVSWAHHRTDAFDVFWNPAFKQSREVMIVLPHPIVYYPSSRASRLDGERHAAGALPLQRAISLPPQMLDGSDFVPVLDQFVGFGDAVAALRMNTLLAQHSIVPKYRFASKVEFTDLRDSTPILIGAFTNRWTAEITKSMRFHFAYDNQKPSIVDSSTGRGWTLTSKTENGRTSEDYLLICRFPHSKTGGFMMVGAGLTVYGTEEAGRILAEPDALIPVLKKLPKNWASQNLEFVLHVEVLDDAPAQPELVAVQTW